MKKILIFWLILTLAFLSFACTATKDISELYTVEKADNGLYKYAINSTDGDLIVAEEGFVKQPDITIVDETVLSVSSQAGTGLSTNWMFFCDVEANKKSETFQYVLGVYKDTVLYATTENGQSKLVAQNVFDSSLKTEQALEDASTAADFVSDASISEKGVASVTYLKGKDFTKTNISMDLNI